jgi:hypothetical protein
MSKWQLEEDVIGGEFSTQGRTEEFIPNFGREILKGCLGVDGRIILKLANGNMV